MHHVISTPSIKKIHHLIIVNKWYILSTRNYITFLKKSKTRTSRATTLPFPLSLNHSATKLSFKCFFFLYLLPSSENDPGRWKFTHNDLPKCWGKFSSRPLHTSTLPPVTGNKYTDSSINYSPVKSGQLGKAFNSLFLFFLFLGWASRNGSNVRTGFVWETKKVGGGLCSSKLLEVKRFNERH